jgi:hypothetical protein
MSENSQIIDVRPSTGRRLLINNSTAAAFTAPTERVGRPSGEGFFELQGTGTASKEKIPASLVIQPWGAGADNTTFDLRIWAYRDLENSFQPILLAQVSCTLCATTGTSGGNLGTGNRYVDTITITAGNANVGLEAVSPTSDLPAHVILVTKGGGVLWFDFDMTGATSGNASIWEL